MAKYPLNLGSTFNEFLNALNTNTEDTEGIIEGTKGIKVLKVSTETNNGNAETIITGGTETNEAGELMPVIKQEASGYVLRTGVEDELGVKHKETGLNSMKGRLSVFSRQEERDDNGLKTIDISATISVNDFGTVNLLSENKVKNETAQILLQNGKIIFNATHGIEGLPSGGGLDIPSEVINYDSENQQLNIYSPNEIYFEASEQIHKMQITKNGISFSVADESAFFNFGIDGNDITACSFECERIDFISGNVNFSGEVDFSNATVIGLPNGGGLDTTADITWEGDHMFNGNVYFLAECGMDYINCDTEATFNGNAYFSGVVDFTNANVIGLPSGGSGGTLAIEVETLPTENIDNSKVYIVAENPQVYLKVYPSLLTLENLLEGFGVTNPVVNYHVVPTLPTEGEATDFVTMTPMHCYINSSNGIAYFYGNLGAGNMWVNAAALFAQMTGTEAEDAGRTYNISNEPTELTLHIYTYWEDVQYVYTINNQWCKVNYSNGFNPDNDYIFTGRNSFEGSTHLKNSVIIGDVDAGRIGEVDFFTERVSFHHGKVTFNNGHEADIDGGVEFYGKVDFTNAIVTGLSGSGLSQEQVQEMINTAINGALEGSY